MSSAVPLEPKLAIRFHHAYFNDPDGVVDDVGFEVGVVPTEQTQLALMSAGLLLRHDGPLAMILGPPHAALPDMLEFTLTTDHLDMFNVTAFQDAPLPQNAALDIVLGPDGVPRTSLSSVEDPPPAAALLGRLQIVSAGQLAPEVDVQFEALAVRRDIVVVDSSADIDLGTVWLSGADRAPLELRRSEAPVQAPFVGMRLETSKLWPLRYSAADDDLLWVHYTGADGQPKSLVAPHPSPDRLEMKEDAVVSVSYIYL